MGYKDTWECEEATLKREMGEWLPEKVSEKELVEQLNSFNDREIKKLNDEITNLKTNLEFYRTCETHRNFTEEQRKWNIDNASLRISRLEKNLERKLSEKEGG